MTFLTKLLGRKKKEKLNPDQTPSRSLSATRLDGPSEVQEAMLLRGLTSPDEYKFRLAIKVGDMLDVQDKEGRWRVADVVKATATHVNVRFIDTGKVFELSLHRGGARIARPVTKSTSTPRSGRSTVGALTVKPSLPSTPSIPPLTPWSPSTVDFAITSSCIIHQPAPPLLTPSSAGRMVIIPMAKDNSCLYHSIAFTCDGQLPRKGLHVMQQRLRAHSLVTADPSTYSSIILGSDPSTYCNKLLDLNTWGGAIELGLFSSLYEVEIFAFDYTRPTVYRFGEEHGYEKRVFLVYSGNHYEAMGWEEEGKVQEFFDVRDDEALRRAQLVVEGLWKKTHSGQVVWAGQGLYELKQKTRALMRFLSPRRLSPRPPPSVNPLHSVSVPTPHSSSHARRSSFTFGMSSRLLSPPPMAKPRSEPQEGGGEGVRSVETTKVEKGSPSMSFVQNQPGLMMEGQGEEKESG